MNKLKTPKFDQYNVGDSIRFSSEKKAYKVVGRNERYVIALKPFNLRKGGYLYTIIDLQEQIRGADHWLFGLYDYRVPSNVRLALMHLRSGKCKISYRNRINLDIAPVG